MRIFAFLMVWLLAATSAWAESRPLIIGVEEQNYLPNYGWIDGAFQGAGAEILTAFAKDQGYQVVFHPLPIRRLYAEAVNGEVDLKFPDSPEWASDTKAGHNFIYSAPVLGYVDGVLVKSANVGRAIDSVHTLGTLSGFTLPNEWRALVDAKSVDLKEATKLDQLLRMLQVGRVDGAYVSVALYVADTILGQKGALVLDTDLPLRRGSYLVSSVKRPEMVEQFNVWLSKHRDQIAAIKAHWGVEN